MDTIAAISTAPGIGGIGIIRISGENDMDYAIDEIISDYMNEIASGRMPLIK